MAGTAELLIKIAADTSDAQKDIDNVASKSDKFGKTMATAGKVAAGALVGVGAAALDAGKAAAEDAQSQAVLATAMKNTTGANEKQIASMEDWISKTAMATGVADDQLRPALGALVRATGDVTKSQEAMGIALDVAAATGKDVGTVSDALAKGYAGQTTAIGKLVPGMDKAILASGDMNVIMAELARTTGGSAAAAADTAAGQMQIMTLSMDEAKEAIGAALLPVMMQLAQVLTTVATWAQNNATAVQILVGVIAGLAAAVLAANAVMKVAGVVTAAWSVALGIHAAATGASTTALNGNKVATIAYNVASKAAAAVTWLFNAALLANPITWVVIAITALIAALVLLWKNFDSVKAACDKCWDVMKSGAAAVGRAVEPVFTAIGDAIQFVIDKVQDLISWFGKIKVPKISLPKIPGFNATATIPAAPMIGATSTAARSTPVGAGVVININGAIDPEATARQVRRLLTGFDVRHGAATTGGLRTV